jgi:predicted TIM-barrel fold metal-dependent hydrolase
MSQLAAHIAQMRLIDSHEHLHGEQEFVAGGPDLLQDLFDNYVVADLLVAGASEEAVRRLLDASDPDLGGRLKGVRDAWLRCRHTGYGEAVRLLARLVYDIAEIAELTPAQLEAAQASNRALRRPGERLRLLRDVANLDHVQVDNFVWECPPDPSGPDFFLYDLSWSSFCRGRLDASAIYAEVGIAVEDIDSLRRAIEALFARHGPLAIAVKSQHAYERTLLWEERSDADAERVLLRQLGGEELSEGERLCLGDWCMARGVEQASAHNLPFKIHTGYYAGTGRMPLERIRPGHLCALLMRYPQARFVLMHNAYPYGDELIAIAKHYPNVYIDMCWAWSIDPLSACDTLRRTIHAVPSNKVFAFGGDSWWPSASVAYAAQTRAWLTRALDAEVNDGLLTEREAIAYATRLMRENQLDCFDVAGRRAALLAAAQRGPDVVTGVPAGLA